MAQLDLSARDAELLGELLTSSLSDLHTEINHTDDRDLRDELKAREENIRGILARIKGLAAK